MDRIYNETQMLTAFKLRYLDAKRRIKIAIADGTNARDVPRFKDPAEKVLIR